MEIKEFEDLVNLGQIRRSLKFGNHDVVMHTLAGDEYKNLSQRIGDPDDKVKFEALQRQIVASSIESLDGKSFTHEEKLTLIGKLQLGLSNTLYTVYLEMVAEQEKLLEDAKKKSSTTKES